VHLSIFNLGKSEDIFLLTQVIRRDLQIEHLLGPADRFLRGEADLGQVLGLGQARFRLLNLVPVRLLNRLLLPETRVVVRVEAFMAELELGRVVEVADVLVDPLLQQLPVQLRVLVHLAVGFEELLLHVVRRPLLLLLVALQLVLGAVFRVPLVVSELGRLDRHLVLVEAGLVDGVGVFGLLVEGVEGHDAPDESLRIGRFLRDAAGVLLILV